MLHTLFQWAVESREYRADNPVTKRGRPKAGDTRQPVVLTDAQLEKLLNECDGRPMLKLFVLLCSETGVRPNSEALWLRWEDVDLERRVLQIVSGRDGHRLRLTGPLFARVIDRFESLLAGMAHRLMATVGRRWGEHSMASPAAAGARA